MWFYTHGTQLDSGLLSSLDTTTQAGIAKNKLACEMHAWRGGLFARLYQVVPSLSSSARNNKPLGVLPRLRECLSIWTSIWHIALISQFGRQGNDAEIRYHYKTLLLVEWRQLHGPRLALVWLTRGSTVGFLTTQCRPSWRDPLRIEITRQQLHRFDVAARVASESNRKSPSYCCRLAYVVDPRRRLRARY